jgi:ribosomal protein L11
LPQAGLNIMAFCKDFNARTQGIKARAAAGASAVLVPCMLHTFARRRFAPLTEHTRLVGQDDVPLPVLVTAYKDKSFEFVRSLIARA